MSNENFLGLYVADRGFNPSEIVTLVPNKPSRDVTLTSNGFGKIERLEDNLIIYATNIPRAVSGAHIANVISAVFTIADNLR